MNEKNIPIVSTDDGKIPTEFITAICESTIKPLTKRGGMKEGMQGMLLGIVTTILTILAGIYLIKIGPEEIRKSIQNSSFLFGWLAAIIIAIAPFLPYVAIMIGIISLIFAIFSGYTFFRTSTSSTMDITCPKCGKVYQFSKTIRRSFSFVCSKCYTLIQGDKSGQGTLHRCNYCDFQYFGAPKKRPSCLSCGYKEGSKDQECPNCKEKIPKEIRFCKYCLTWLSTPETHEVSLMSQPVVYDVSCFSTKACLSFIKNLVPRINKNAESIDKSLSPIDNLKKSVQLYGNGGLIWTIEPAMNLIKSCTTAIQWLYSNGGTLETYILKDFNESLNKIAKQIERIQAYDMFLKKQSNEFGNIITITKDTTSAAIKLS